MIRRLVQVAVIASFAATLGACGSRGSPRPGKSPSSPPPVVAPPEVLRAPSSGAPANQGPPPSAPPPAPSVPPAVAAEDSEVRFSAHYPPELRVSLLAWKQAHHARGPSFEQECWQLSAPVGTPPAPALLCVADNRSPEFTLARIYRLDGAELREVWSAIIATYMNWLELTPLVAADGLSLELRDRTADGCRNAIAEYKGKRSAHVAPPSGELLEPACKKVGSYVFQDGAFHFRAKGPGAQPAPSELSR